MFPSFLFCLSVQVILSFLSRDQFTSGDCVSCESRCGPRWDRPHEHWWTVARPGVPPARPGHHTGNTGGFSRWPSGLRSTEFWLRSLQMMTEPTVWQHPREGTFYSVDYGKGFITYCSSNHADHLSAVCACVGEVEAFFIIISQNTINYFLNLSITHRPCHKKYFMWNYSQFGPPFNFKSFIHCCSIPFVWSVTVLRFVKVIVALEDLRTF